MKSLPFVGSLSLLAYSMTAVYAAEQHHDHHHHSHGDNLHSDAPVGVMASHVHSAGEWMFSYRFMRMNMDDMYDGTDSVSTASLLQMGGDYNYMMVPTDMTMDMHMFGGMYAMTDTITIMGMVNYINNDMSMERRMGMPLTFDTESSGLGDISLNVLYKIHSEENLQFHGSLGLSLPTGSIDEEDDTPMGDDMHLPYSMQLGSGTFDLKPSITYLGTATDMSWGVQAAAVLRLGENDNDYTLGNRSQLTAWCAYNKHKAATFTARLDFQQWGNIDGADSELTMMPTMNPNADPDLRGGSRLDFGLGLNSTIQQHRFSMEFLFPLQQDLDGPQMAIANSFILGYQFYH